MDTIQTITLDLKNLLTLLNAFSLFRLFIINIWYLKIIHVLNRHIKNELTLWTYNTIISSGPEIF